LGVKSGTYLLTAFIGLMSHGTTVLGTLSSGGRVLERYSLPAQFTTLPVSYNYRSTSVIILETDVKLRQSCLALFKLFCVKSCIVCGFSLWYNYCYVCQCLNGLSLGFLCTFDFIVPSDVTLHAVLYVFFIFYLCLVVVLVVCSFTFSVCLLLYVHFLLCCLIGILKNMYIYK